jgi:four helix bundle protein
MTPDELKKRTKQFALRIMKLYKSLPKGKDAEVLGMQLLRAATSVGANYRAACRARSEADFISKITIVEEEADESAYWIELLIDSGIVKKELLSEILKEANELTAIFTASGNTAKLKRVNSQFKIRNSKLSNVESK